MSLSPSVARRTRERDSASAGMREAASNAAASRRPPCPPRRSTVFAGLETASLVFGGFALGGAPAAIFAAFAFAEAGTGFCDARAPFFRGAGARFLGARTRRCLVGHLGHHKILTQYK